MPDTFTQLYVQLVFAVRGRENLIRFSWEERLYKYITGIIQNKDQKLFAINGMPDHIHLLISMKPTCCISDLVREIKKSSTEFIKDNRFTNFNFHWQEGFGGFTYSHSQLDQVVRYIIRQKDHHKKRTFREEYIEFLKGFAVKYSDEHLFDWIEH
jgi:REP element-mobilizing transposase RayT